MHCGVDYSAVQSNRIKKVTVSSIFFRFGYFLGYVGVYFAEKCYVYTVHILVQVVQLPTCNAQYVTQFLNVEISQLLLWT